jgi:PAS domain S-box-containing protein
VELFGVSALSDSQRLLFIIDHSLDFVEFLGGGGLIKGVSGAIKTLGGYDPEQLIGTHYQEILHPQDCAPAAAAFGRVLRGEPVAPITVRYRHQDGSWRTIQVSARNFLDDPAVRAVIILTRDMTDQLNAEASLATANIEPRRLSQRLIVAQEEERTRIARELHDNVQQILVGLRMSMEPSKGAQVSRAPQDCVAIWIGYVQEAIDHLHALTVTFRGPVIGEGGLATELRSYVDRLPLTPDQDIDLDVEENLGHLAPEVELACFRIVQDALANAIKHSGSKQVNVLLKNSDRGLSVSIRDDGVGFDVKAARLSATVAGRIGLLSMRERAALVGGRLEVNSSIGHGTDVSAVFPISASVAVNAWL